MRKFKINVVSQENIIALLVLSFAIFIFICVEFPPKKVNAAFFIFFVLIYFSTIIFLWSKFVTGITEWTIDEKGISIKWIKRFFLAKDNDINLKWEEIKKLSIGFDPLYSIFIIKLKVGEKLRFIHDNSIFRKDDIEEFSDAFQQAHQKL